MALVVDDHLLLDLLAEVARGSLLEEAAESAVYTTGGWYYRVASAADHGTGRGSLSARISALPEDDQRAIRSRVADLPEAIGMIGPRTLIPVMAGLRTPRQLNFLSAEALAVALLTESSIAVRTDSPPLREACAALQVIYRVVRSP